MATPHDVRLVFSLLLPNAAARPCCRSSPHAIGADTTPVHLGVQLVSPGQPASEIAEIADTGRSKTRPELLGAAG